MKDAKCARRGRRRCGRFVQARPERAAVRRYAERFGWIATTTGQLDLFSRIVREQAAAARAR